MGCAKGISSLQICQKNQFFFADVKFVKSDYIIYLRPLKSCSYTGITDLGNFAVVLEAVESSSIWLITSLCNGHSAPELCKLEFLQEMSPSAICNLHTHWNVTALDMQKNIRMHQLPLSVKVLDF